MSSEGTTVRAGRPLPANNRIQEMTEHETRNTAQVYSDSDDQTVSACVLSARRDMQDDKRQQIRSGKASDDPGHRSEQFTTYKRDADGNNVMGAR